MVSRYYLTAYDAEQLTSDICVSLGINSSFLIIWFDRESATPDKVKEAHRKVMVANHPDAGGSHYLASKINEAKDVMLGKTKGSGSAF